MPAPNPAAMPTAALLAHIEQLQQIQKTHAPKTQAWQTASELLQPCLAEMARGEPARLSG